jgi:hypothetical protein
VKAFSNRQVGKMVRFENATPVRRFVAVNNLQFIIDDENFITHVNIQDENKHVRQDGSIDVDHIDIRDSGRLTNDYGAVEVAFRHPVTCIVLDYEDMVKTLLCGSEPQADEMEIWEKAAKLKAE